MNITTLTEKINANNRLDFGDIFSKSIELFKKSWLQGFLFTILSILMMIPAGIIVYIGMLSVLVSQGISQYKDMDMNMDSESIFMLMLPFLLLFFLVIIFMNAIIYAMIAGFFKTIKKFDDDEEASTADIFMYMKGKYLKKTFVISLIAVAISLVITGLCYMFFIMTDSFGLSLVLYYLPVLYIMVPFNFFMVIFAFNPELSATEVIKASFNIGNKKWLLGFGLIIVSSILAQIVGLILCGIGVLFTAAFVYHPLYFMYKGTVGFEDGEDTAEVPAA